MAASRGSGRLELRKQAGSQKHAGPANARQPVCTQKRSAARSLASRPGSCLFPCGANIQPIVSQVPLRGTSFCFGGRLAFLTASHRNAPCFDVRQRACRASGSPAPPITQQGCSGV
jgi:hypothetical protein